MESQYGRATTVYRLSRFRRGVDCPSDRDAGRIWSCLDSGNGSNRLFMFHLPLPSYLSCIDSQHERVGGSTYHDLKSKTWTMDQRKVQGQRSCRSKVAGTSKQARSTRVLVAVSQLGLVRVGMATYSYCTALYVASGKTL